MVSTRKTVYVAMTADILHHGHINVIETGRTYGEVIVGLLTDRAVCRRKRMPYLDYEHRKRIVENIQGVAKVVPQDDWDIVPNLRAYRPDFVVHGDDWCEGEESCYRDGAFAAIAEWGGRIIEVPYTPGVSSSRLDETRRALGTTPNIRLRTLRRLLRAKDLVRVMEAHSPLSGLIVENARVERDGCPVGFDAMWASSLTDSTVRGKPDIEAVDLTSRLVNVNEIFEVTTKPLIFDADTGGQVEHFRFNIRSLERMGVSATIIEDKVGLKKNSLLGNGVPQRQADIDDFCAKISHGKAAQVTDDFMIIARIESLILDAGLEDALTRARAYVDAGADAVMIHSRKPDVDEIAAFCARFRAEDPRTPLVACPSTYSQVYESELVAMGVNLVIYANQLLRSAYPAMWQTAHSILRCGRAAEAEGSCLSIKEILNLIPGTA